MIAVCRSLGRLAVYTVLSTAVLLATTLLFAGVLAALPFTVFDLNADLYLGLAAALVLWLAVAGVVLRRHTLAVPAVEPELALEKIRLILSDLGYATRYQNAGRVHMRPEFQSLLGGGAVQVWVEGSGVRVAGPRVTLVLVRNHLRLQEHLQKLQRSTLSSRRRQGEKHLKRVELTLQLTPEQLRAVQTGVIGVLEETAAVKCVLHLLAQSDNGIPESVLEYRIRNWLDRNEIAAEVRRDFVEWAEPAGEPTLSESATG